MSEYIDLVEEFINYICKKCRMKLKTEYQYKKHIFECEKKKHEEISVFDYLQKKELGNVGHALLEYTAPEIFKDEKIIDIGLSSYGQTVIRGLDIEEIKRRKPVEYIDEKKQKWLSKNYVRRKSKMEYILERVEREEKLKKKEDLFKNIYDLVRYWNNWIKKKYGKTFYKEHELRRLRKEKTAEQVLRIMCNLDKLYNKEDLLYWNKFKKEVQNNGE